MDAISAEDIGKFPDVDIAAALQHVPGVTISRGASMLGGVATSTGNATRSRFAASARSSMKPSMMAARFPAAPAAPSTSAPSARILSARSM